MTAEVINYKEAYEKLEKEFEQYKKESIKYTVDDIIDADSDYGIDEGEAQDALEHMISTYKDKSDFINEEVLMDYLHDFGYNYEDVENDDYNGEPEDEEDYQDDDQIIM